MKPHSKWLNSFTKKSCLAGAGSLLLMLTSTSAASWTLLDDFEDGFDGWDITNIYSDSNELFVLDDPINSGNKTFYVESGGYGVVGFNTARGSYTLPDEVKEGSTTTFFFRYCQKGPSNAFHFVLSDVAKEKNDEGVWVSPGAWGDVETVFRLNQGDMAVRDAGTYPLLGTGDSADTFTTKQLANDTWYNFWMVVYNKTGYEEDTYEMYVQGGEFTEATKLKLQEVVQGSNPPELSGNIIDEGYFRNGTEDSLVTLMIVSESGPSDNPYNGDLWYIDDIGYTDGKVVEVPDFISGGGSTGETWAGYPVADNGNVDTGSWLGWVNVANAPTVYVYDLGSWVYLPEPDANATGCWVYTFK